MPNHPILVRNVRKAIPVATERRSGKNRRGLGTRISWCGTDDPPYTADELEFMMAMDAYKQQYQRPYPTCCEILAVLVSLGYSKLTN